jgi:hypothetical protein
MGMLEALIHIEGELRLPPEIQAHNKCSTEWLKSFEYYDLKSFNVFMIITRFFKASK